MGVNLTWKTKLLKNRYDIFQDDLHIGELKAGIWSKTSQGEINGKKYLFKTKGFVTNETQIIKQEDNSIAGTIIFSTWKGKARIIIANKEYICEPGNLFDTKWSISKEGKSIIDYKT
ncbi:MAG TPA: hypothetical protein PKM69_02505, partial [Bacteroidales bacterium]|nr:hypothetical protein [Bacteroidales bacterium]